jgi:hypothetical protein
LTFSVSCPSAHYQYWQRAPRNNTGQAISGQLFLSSEHPNAREGIFHVRAPQQGCQQSLMSAANQGGGVQKA